MRARTRVRVCVRAYTREGDARAQALARRWRAPAHVFGSIPRMCTVMRIDMHTKMRIRMRTIVTGAGMCVDIRIDMRKDMRIGMCIGTCLGICTDVHATERWESSLATTGSNEYPATPVPNAFDAPSAMALRVSKSDCLARTWLQAWLQRQQATHPAAPSFGGGAARPPRRRFVGL